MRDRDARPGRASPTPVGLGPISREVRQDVGAAGLSWGPGCRRPGGVDVPAQSHSDAWTGALAERPVSVEKGLRGQ